LSKRAYPRTEEANRRMASICSEAADGKHIRSRRAKHRVRAGVKERYCTFCLGWQPLKEHYHTRVCRSRHGFVRYAYDCKIERKPYMAYYSAVSRCKHNPAYKGIEVRMSVQDWVPWWREQQAELKLRDPVVDRIDVKGHYARGNIQLMERSENSKKMWVDKLSPLHARIAALEKEVEDLLRGG
jgi:hypothetical protein